MPGATGITLTLGVSEKLRPLSVKPRRALSHLERGRTASSPSTSMWQLHEGTHLVAVKACAGNPEDRQGCPRTLAGRDFVHTPTAPTWAAHRSSDVVAEAPLAPCGPGWSAHQNIDMCGQGDVEIIHNWRATHSIEDLQRIVEQAGAGLPSLSVGPAVLGHAALKQFPHQLTAGHRAVSGYVLQPSVRHRYNLGRRRRCG